MATVFFSYSHNDEQLRDQLEKHLTMLKREGAISTWHDRRIIAGEPLDADISKWLESADVILLLISSDFLASEYCYSREMKRAMERHTAGEARVIPVILRPCDWHTAPFGKLAAAPKDGKPVTKWANFDDAFLDIAIAVRSAVTGHSHGVASQKPTPVNHIVAAVVDQLTAPRSSNLRIRKTFTERERDAFLDATFEFMARFFENSLAELQSRNAGIEGSFKRVDAARFSAAVYRAGTALSRCTVRLGGIMGSGITLSLGPHSENSYNESLSVFVDDQEMFLKAMGFRMVLGGGRDSKLSQEGAAEYYWSLFIERLQE